MNDSPGHMPLDTPHPDSLPPDYSQQSDQPGYQNPPAKNSQQKWRIATAGALILILVVGSLSFFVAHVATQSSPASTLQTYCEASKKMDAHELYSTLSTSFRAQPRNGEANFQFGFGLLKSLGTSFTDCTVDNIQQNGSTAKATVTLTSRSAQGQSTSSIQTLSLIVENGMWKVNDIESN